MCETRQPPPRCVVTGAAGFIGSHLVDRLLAEGHDVVGLDAWDDWYPVAAKRSNLAGAMASPSFDLRRADTTVDDLTAVLEPGDLVFHLAARPGVQDSWGAGFETAMRVNVTGTQRVFDAALRRGCRRVVFASSSSVYGDSAGHAGERVVAPVSPYGVSKAAGEQLADVYSDRGLDVVALRYFTVYGARQRPDMAFHRLFRAASPDRPDVFPLRGSGEQRREFTHVSDVVAATIAAGSAPSARGRWFDVGGGTSARLLDVMETIERITGTRLRVEHQPPAAGDPETTVAECGPAAAELGWEPRVELIHGLVDQWDWHLSQLGSASLLAG